MNLPPELATRAHAHPRLGVAIGSVELPLLARVDVPLGTSPVGRRVAPHLVAGPSFDVGVTFGGGVALDIGRAAITLDARWEQGQHPL